MAEPASASTDPILPGFRPKLAEPKRPHPALVFRDHIAAADHLTGAEKATLYALAQCMDAAGMMRASSDELAQWSGNDSRTVERHVALFRAIGDITWRSGKASRARNVYEWTGYLRHAPNWRSVAKTILARERASRDARSNASDPVSDVLRSCDGRNVRSESTDHAAAEDETSPGSEADPKGATTERPAQVRTARACSRCTCRPAEGAGFLCAKCRWLWNGIAAARVAPFLPPVDLDALYTFEALSPDYERDAPHA